MARALNGSQRGLQFGRGRGRIRRVSRRRVQPLDEPARSATPGVDIARKMHAAHRALAREFLAARFELGAPCGHQVRQ